MNGTCLFVLTFAPFILNFLTADAPSPSSVDFANLHLPLVNVLNVQPKVKLAPPVKDEPWQRHVLAQF